MLARRPSKGLGNTDLRQSTSNIKKQNRVDLIIEQQNRVVNSQLTQYQDDLIQFQDYHNGALRPKANLNQTNGS